MVLLNIAIVNQLELSMNELASVFFGFGMFKTSFIRLMSLEYLPYEECNDGVIRTILFYGNDKFYKSTGLNGKVRLSPSS